MCTCVSVGDRRYVEKSVYMYIGSKEVRLYWECGGIHVHVHMYLLSNCL